MPVKSKAQWRFMQAAAHAKSTKPFGIPPKVAKEFVAADKKQHVSYKSLPEHK